MLPRRSRCLLLLTAIVSSIWISCGQAGAQGLNGNLPCSPENVAIERVVHRTGLSASASVLMAKPRNTNNHILCYTKSTSGGRKSQIFCLSSPMDDLQMVSQQFVISIDGLVTHFETAATQTHQYIIIFAVHRSPVLYEVTIHDNSRVSFDSPRTIGNHGALHMAISYTESAIALAVSSGRHCKDGDLMCTQPAAYLIDGHSGALTHCSFPPQSSEPAEFVATWSHGGVAYLVFAVLLPNNPHVYWMTWHRVVQYPNGQCGVHYAGDISFGRPICGIRSIEVIHSIIDGVPKYSLLVASQACPDVHPQEHNGPQFVNVLHQTWDPVAQQFIGTSIGELPGTGTVTQIGVISDQFFLCQKSSEPSSIHSLMPMPMASGLVGTVRINSQATISAVQSANGDAYISHVTSTGAVVIDWISCSSNQHLPSNYTLSRFASNPFIIGPLPQDNVNLTDTVDEYAGDNHILPIPANRKSSLYRSDRDSPHSWKLEASNLGLSQSDQNATFTDNNNQTDTSRNEGTVVFDMGQQVDPEEPKTVQMPYGHYPMNVEMVPPPYMGNGAPLPPVPPPQIMPENGQSWMNNNVPPPVSYPMNFPPPSQSVPPPPPVQPYWNGQPNPNVNNWPGQILNLQYPPQNGYGMTPAVMGPNTPFPGQFIPNFGGPQPIPGGGTLAGYFTFPPIVVFAPVPQMQPYPNFNNVQQQPNVPPQQMNQEVRPPPPQQQQPQPLPTQQQYFQQQPPPTPTQYGYGYPNQPVNMPPQPLYDVVSVPFPPNPYMPPNNMMQIPPVDLPRANPWESTRIEQTMWRPSPQPEVQRPQDMHSPNSPLLRPAVIALPPYTNDINVSINRENTEGVNNTVLEFRDINKPNVTKATWTIPTESSSSTATSTISGQSGSTEALQLVSSTGRPQAVDCAPSTTSKYVESTSSGISEVLSSATVSEGLQQSTTQREDTTDWS